MPDLIKYNEKLLSRSFYNITWISKPLGGCSGHGIQLHQRIRDFQNEKNSVIVQLYIPPFLLHSYKFDFRFYLFISTLSPFTVYLYHEGIARFCTNSYVNPTRDNLKDHFIHLTNTAINLKNPHPQHTFTRPASSIIEEITLSNYRTTGLWEEIKTVCALTMISIYPEILKSITEFENLKTTNERALSKYIFASTSLKVVSGLPPIKKIFTFNWN